MSPKPPCVVGMYSRLLCMPVRVGASQTSQSELCLELGYFSLHFLPSLASSSRQ